MMMMMMMIVLVIALLRRNFRYLNKKMWKRKRKILMPNSLRYYNYKKI
jgi:hypothetical protein